LTKIIYIILVSLVFLNPYSILPLPQSGKKKRLKSLLEMSYNLFGDGMIPLEYKQRERPLGAVKSGWWERRYKYCL
jgi:hypothetical protein